MIPGRAGETVPDPRPPVSFLEAEAAPIYHDERSKFRPAIVYPIAFLALLTGAQMLVAGSVWDSPLVCTLALILAFIAAIPCWLAWRDFQLWLELKWPRVSAVWTFPLVQFSVWVAILIGCDWVVRHASNYAVFLYFVGPRALFGIFHSIVMSFVMLSTVSGQHLPMARSLGFWVLAFGGIGLLIDFAGLRDIGNLIIGVAGLILLVDLVVFSKGREEYRQEGGRLSLSLIALALFVAGLAAWVLTGWSL